MRPAIRRGPRRRPSASEHERRPLGRELRYAVVRMLLGVIALPCLLLWHVLNLAGMELE